MQSRQRFLTTLRTKLLDEGEKVPAEGGNTGADNSVVLELRVNMRQLSEIFPGSAPGLVVPLELVETTHFMLGNPAESKLSGTVF